MSDKTILEKRIDAHCSTIGIWLASTVIQEEHETLRQFKERLISLGARHSFDDIDIMKAVVNEKTN